MEILLRTATNESAEVASATCSGRRAGTRSNRPPLAGGPLMTSAFAYLSATLSLSVGFHQSLSQMQEGQLQMTAIVSPCTPE